MRLYNLQLTMVVALMFAFGYMLQLATARATSDYQTIDFMIKERKILEEKIVKLIKQVDYSDRINDLLTGRLYEMTKFATGEIDQGLDAFKNLMKRMESDMAAVDEERKKLDSDYIQLWMNYKR